MPLGYTNLLVTAQSDGAAVSNTLTETSLLPTNARYVVPANYLQFVGQELIVEASGRISTLVTTPGTIQFNINYGGILVAQSGQLALNVVAKTNVTWWLTWALTARALGTSGNFMHTGFFTSEAVVGSPVPAVGGAGTLPIPASAPAVGANFNNTNANLFLLTAQWSVANAANSIQLQQYRLYNPN